MRTLHFTRKSHDAHECRELFAAILLNVLDEGLRALRLALSPPWV